MADFYLVSRRERDALESRVVRYHFLLGADWKLCCQQLEAISFMPYTGSSKSSGAFSPNWSRMVCIR
jgi:hypothetical protein